MCFYQIPVEILFFTFGFYEKGLTFAPLFFEHDSLAQQVEHIPFKDGVLGSNPRRIT